MGQSIGTSSGGSAVYRLEQPPFEEICGGVECLLADALAVVWLSVLALLGVVAIAALLHLNDARSTCERERRRVRRERDAFQRFARTVAEIEPVSGPQGGTATAGATLTATSRSKPGSQRVMQLYRDTVMDVDHFDEEYGEPLETHMAAELGEEVRTAVCSEPGLGAKEQRAVVASATEASRRRARLLEAIDDELAAIDDADGTLTAALEAAEAEEDGGMLDRGFEDLQAEWEVLDERIDDCEALLERRQERIHDGIAVTGQRWDGHDFYEYLYRPLPVSHPVLASGALALDRLRTRQRRIELALTRRV